MTYTAMTDPITDATERRQFDLNLEADPGAEEVVLSRGTDALMAAMKMQTKTKG